jgi:small GTP-binding protein
MKDIFDELEKNGVTITPEKRNIIEKRFTEKCQYEPVIAFLGKTGAGKSSLCNALFGEKIFEVSDIKACTRDPQTEILKLGGKGIVLMDVPGVGETNERDKEYAELYANLLPKIDLVLWVLKADDRAFSSDQKFYNDIVKPHIDQGKPFYFVLNQVDKIEPFQEWDVKGRKPGVTQFSNIHAKIAEVSKYFEHPESEVVAVSANERYNLVNLMDTVIYALPGTKRFTAYCKVPAENRSEEQGKSAVDGLIDGIGDTIQEGLGDMAGEVFRAAATNPKIVKGILKFVKPIVGKIPIVGPYLTAGISFLESLFN